MTHRAIVIDDEELAVRRLVRLLEEFPEIVVVGTAASGREAIEVIDREKPDLVFLDIQMPGLSGFDVLGQIHHSPLVIFTTAFDEYALKAFEENSVDYLLKPIEKARLAQALKKLERFRGEAVRPDRVLDGLRQLVQTIEATAGRPSRISIRLGNRTLVLDVATVAAFVAEERLTFAWAGDQTYPVDLTLDELERRLANHRFLRVHRSALVNLDAVREIHSWFGGKLRLRLKAANREVTVSRERARTVREALSI